MPPVSAPAPAHQEMATGLSGTAGSTAGDSSPFGQAGSPDPQSPARFPEHPVTPAVPTSQPSTNRQVYRRIV